MANTSSDLPILLRLEPSPEEPKSVLVDVPISKLIDERWKYFILGQKMERLDYALSFCEHSLFRGRHSPTVDSMIMEARRKQWALEEAISMSVKKTYEPIALDTTRIFDELYSLVDVMWHLPSPASTDVEAPKFCVGPLPAAASAVSQGG